MEYSPEHDLDHSQTLKCILPEDESIIELELLRKDSQTGRTFAEQGSALFLLKDFSVIFNLVKESEIVPPLAKQLVQRSYYSPIEQPNVRSSFSNVKNRQDSNEFEIIYSNDVSSSDQVSVHKHNDHLVPKTLSIACLEEEKVDDTHIINLTRKIMQIEEMLQDSSIEYLEIDRRLNSYVIKSLKILNGKRMNKKQVNQCSEIKKLFYGLQPDFLKWYLKLIDIYESLELIIKEINEFESSYKIKLSDDKQQNTNIQAVSIGSTLLGVVTIPVLPLSLSLFAGGASLQILQYQKKRQIQREKQIKTLKHSLLIFLKEKHQLLRKIVHEKVSIIKRNLEFLVNSLQSKDGISLESLESILNQLNEKNFLKSSNFMTFNIQEALALAEPYENYVQ